MAEALITEITQRCTDVEFAVRFAEPDIQHFTRMRNVKSIIVENDPMTFPGLKSLIAAIAKRPKSVATALAPSLAKCIFRTQSVSHFDAVFDISGYSIGDKWGLRHATNVLKMYKHFAGCGSKIFFLPKTFGPFETPGLSEIANTILRLSTVVFCRDTISHRYLHESCEVEQSKVFVFPDYTAAVPGCFPKRLERLQNRAAIIPNYRMLDKTDRKTSTAYLGFICHAIERLRSEGHAPFMLLHQRFADKKVSDALKYAHAWKIETVRESDHRVVKGIIGKCSLVISSRLHGIINGLSQGVPTIGTGWSHKYKAVFDDYRSPGLLITDVSNRREFDNILAKCLSPASAAQITKTLKCSKADLVRKNAEMWDIIAKHLETKRVSSNQSQGHSA